LSGGLKSQVIETNPQQIAMKKLFEGRRNGGIQ
jgi:hypothetical protein